MSTTNEYPKILKNKKHNYIVEFTKDRCGTVIQGNKTYETGTFSRKWTYPISKDDWEVVTNHIPNTN